MCCVLSLTHIMVSIFGLAEKLILCRDNYQRLAAEAKETKMEPLEFIGSKYVKMWTKVLAEAL